MSRTFSPKVDAARLTRMVEVSRELNSATDLDDLLKLIISEAADLTNAEAASILLFDQYTRELRFKATSGEMPPAMKDMPVSISNSIAGAVWRANAPLIINDVANDPRWNSQVDQAIDFRTASILGVPMHDVKRQVGVLEAINKRHGSFTHEDVEILVILADLAGVAVEKARLIGELRQAYQKLNELDRLKSDFIALASHELRTPLSIILGYVSFLREDASSDMASQLDSVLRAAVRLRDLIQDMLNLRYVDVNAGAAAVSLAPVNFARLVRNVVVQRDETAVAKQQTVNVIIHDEELPVMADEAMMELVVNNIFNNAVKFTGEGGCIDISVKRIENEAWLTISDNGIGIPTDQLERIFDRFYQVEPHMRRHYGGMGLGLAIVKDLVSLNHGRVWVKSQAEQGSEFNVVLPLATV
jgi:signal transduction histidine kinase